MTKAEALALLDLLPRYGKYSAAPWYPRQGGEYILLNAHRPTLLDDLWLKRRMATCNGEKIVGSSALIGNLKPWKFKFYCLQTRVLRRTMRFMLKNFSRVSRTRIGSDGKHWPRFVEYRGKLFLWNGHHRIFAAILLRRPIRCEIVILKPLRGAANGRQRRRRRQSAHRTRRSRAKQPARHAS